MEDERDEQRRAWWRLPSVLEAAAAGRLVVGDDDRAERQGTSHVLGRRDRLEVDDSRLISCHAPDVTACAGKLVGR